jgi:hypothetical protein
MLIFCGALFCGVQSCDVLEIFCGELSSCVSYDVLEIFYDVLSSCEPGIFCGE